MKEGSDLCIHCTLRCCILMAAVSKRKQYMYSFHTVQPQHDSWQKLANKAKSLEKLHHKRCIHDAEKVCIVSPYETQ